MAIVLLPTALTLLVAGGSHWTTRDWLQTTVRGLSRTEEYANGLRSLIGTITHLQLCDVSDGHVLEGARDGRALAAAGIELQCLVVSEAFESVTRIARQQRVKSYFECARRRHRTATSESDTPPARSILPTQLNYVQAASTR